MPSVLISHAHEEKALAEAWKNLLEAATGGTVKVWFSSDAQAGGGMEITTPWIDQVKARLTDVDHVIAIQTPATEGRRWILYECGYADGQGKGVTPIVYKLDPGLPPPLGAFNAYRGDSEAEVRAACTKLLQSFGLTLYDVTFNALFEPYLQQVELHAPRRMLKPQYVNQWVDRIEELVRSGRSLEVPGKRLEAYHALIGKPPETSTPSDVTMPLHELLSRVLLELKCFDDALVEANLALSVVPEDTEMLHRKAMALVEIGNGADGLRLVQALMNENPFFRDNAELASLEGRIYREQWQVSGNTQDLDRAFGAYLRAYRADTSQHFPGINAASLALARGDLATASTMFTELLDNCRNLLPGQRSFWTDFIMGEALLGLGDISGALGAYEAGLNWIPAPPARARDSALKGVRRMLSYRQLTEHVPAFEQLLDRPVAARSAPETT